MPTVEAIVGNKIAPGLLDRYLGRTGYDSQQTDQPEDPNRPNNLWEPVPGDHGAHGTFDARAHERSYEFLAARYRNWITAGIFGAISAAGVYFAFASNRSRARRKPVAELFQRAA